MAFQFGAFQFGAFQMRTQDGRSGVNRLALIELYEKEEAERKARRAAELAEAQATPARTPERAPRVFRVPKVQLKAERAAPTPQRREVHEAAKRVYLRPQRREPEFNISAVVREALRSLPQVRIQINDYAAEARLRRQRQEEELVVSQALALFYT